METPIKEGTPLKVDKVWDEAELEQALQRLKLLHIKSRTLRDAIPRMISPLVQKQPSPEVMFRSFMTGVNEAQSDMKNFRALMQDEESKAIFAKAESSVEEDPMAITPWKFKDDPDWFSPTKKES